MTRPIGPAARRILIALKDAPGLKLDSSALAATAGTPLSHLGTVAKPLIDRKLVTRSRTSTHFLYWITDAGIDHLKEIDSISPKEISPAVVSSNLNRPFVDYSQFTVADLARQLIQCEDAISEGNFKRYAILEELKSRS